MFSPSSTCVHPTLSRPPRLDPFFLFLVAACFEILKIFCFFCLQQIFCPFHRPAVILALYTAISSSLFSSLPLPGILLYLGGRSSLLSSLISHIAIFYPPRYPHPPQILLSLCLSLRLKTFQFSCHKLCSPAQLSKQGGVPFIPPHILRKEMGGRRALTLVFGHKQLSLIIVFLFSFPVAMEV